MPKIHGLSEDEKEQEKDLVKYLLARGKIQSVTQAQMYKARHMYITEGKDAVTIANALKLTPTLINTWAIQFDWKEERNKILYSKFCDLQKLKEKKAAGLSDRHDRIAANLEDQLEDLLNRTSTGEIELNPKDLGILARALGLLQGVRRTNHKMDQTIKVEKNIKETRVLETGDNFNAMVDMLKGLFGNSVTPEELKVIDKQPLAIEDNHVEEVADSLDVDFKVL